MQTLLGRGADVNARDWQANALCAASVADKNVVQLLLGWNAGGNREGGKHDENALIALEGTWVTRNEELQKA